MAIVEVLVGAGALVVTVEENEQRSTTHREWIAGDPNTRDHNLFERVSQLEDEIEA